MSQYIIGLSSCDAQTQNAYYLSRWVSPLATPVLAAEHLTECVSNYGDYLITAGKTLDFNLLNSHWAEAGDDYGDILIICLGDVPFPNKTLMI